MKVTRNSIVLLILAFVFLIFGCAKKDDVVKVGSILSLSGSLAQYGELTKRGIELASEDINANGGINGKKIEMIYEDSALEPKLGITALNKLINVDNVEIVVGCVGSSVCLALAPVANETKTVVISAGATSPKLSEAGPYFFRVAPSDVYNAVFLVKWLKEENIKTVGIVYLNNEYGVGLKNQAVYESEQENIEVLISEGILEQQNDFRSMLQKFKRLSPDAILLFTHSEEAGYVLKQSREIGLNSDYYGGDALSDPIVYKIAGNTIDGLKYVIPSSGTGELYMDFKEKYLNKYREEPSAVPMKSYSALMIAAEAIKNGGYNGEEIQKNLLLIKEFDTPMGIIHFDKNGDVIGFKYDKLIYKSNGKTNVIK
ncbi:MAG: ABC transporter substrate-binding protein [Candidatus Delongbacteria bacterium]|nr:ABC transporter substrate-binding protein [Candidatus Delongbacteria bacterium]